MKTYTWLAQVKLPDREETIQQVVERLGVRRTFADTDRVEWLLLLAAIFLGIAGRVAGMVLRWPGGCSARG